MQGECSILKFKSGLKTERPARRMGSMQTHNKEKADNSYELSALVAGGGLEPPTFGL